MCFKVDVTLPAANIFPVALLSLKIRDAKSKLILKGGIMGDADGNTSPINWQILKVCFAAV